jgi:hypothetical protein
MGVRLPALNSIMLSGFDGAAGLRTTRAQKKPKPLVDPTLVKRPNSKNQNDPASDETRSTPKGSS